MLFGSERAEFCEKARNLRMLRRLHGARYARNPRWTAEIRALGGRLERVAGASVARPNGGRRDRSALDPGQRRAQAPRTIPPGSRTARRRRSRRECDRVRARAGPAIAPASRSPSAGRSRSRRSCAPTCARRWPGSRADRSRRPPFGRATEAPATRSRRPPRPCLGRPARIPGVTGPTCKRRNIRKLRAFSQNSAR